MVIRMSIGNAWKKATNRCLQKKLCTRIVNIRKKRKQKKYGLIG